MSKEIEIIDKVKSIQDKVNALHEERKRYNDELRSVYLEKARTLEWAKNKEFHYTENPFGAYGSHEYVLEFSFESEVIKGLDPDFTSTTIIEKSSNYQDNLVLTSNFYGSGAKYVLKTCRVPVLIEFLDRTNAKIYGYEVGKIDEKLNLLEALKRHKK